MATPLLKLKNVAQRLSLQHPKLFVLALCLKRSSLTDLGTQQVLAFRGSIHAKPT